jgi:hypothetical protein
VGQGGGGGGGAVTVWVTVGGLESELVVSIEHVSVTVEKSVTVAVDAVIVATQVEGIIMLEEEFKEPVSVLEDGILEPGEDVKAGKELCSEETGSIEDTGPNFEESDDELRTNVESEDGLIPEDDEAELPLKLTNVDEVFPDDERFPDDDGVADEIPPAHAPYPA